MRTILLATMLLCSYCYGEVETLTGVEALSSFGNENISVHNDNMQLMNGNVNKINTVLRDRFTGGILRTAYGGTGKDFSSVPANNLIYTSSTGTFSNVGISTVNQGYYFTVGNPITYLEPPDIPVIVILENETVTIENGSSTTSSALQLTSSGDWSGKKWSFIGEICDDRDVCTGSTTASSAAYYSGSTSTFVGPFLYSQVTGGGTTDHESHRSVISYNGEPVEVSSNWGNGDAGNAECSLTISSGNLVLIASRGADGSGNSTTVNCEVSGIVTREP